MKTTTMLRTTILDTEKRETAIPLDPGRLSKDEESFVETFASMVIGQPEAKELALTAYNAINNPVRDKNRPAGIYFLIGPSRTGKSLTGRTLARLFHGSEDAVTTLQGGDYREDAQVLDLKGAPPMYAGYKDPTDDKNLKLGPDDIDPTSVISSHNLLRARRGSSREVDIIIIDEFEKSAPEFYKLWMGVFDTAFLRLGNGQEVDFSNAIFVLTSNLGMHDLEKLAKGPMGFTNGRKRINKETVSSVVQNALVKAYPPEFRNRLDAIVLFQPFEGNAKQGILIREIEVLQERIDTQMGNKEAFGLRFTEAAKTFTLNVIESATNGIADIKRILERLVVTPVSREYRKGTVCGGDLVIIDLDASAGVLTYSVSKNGRGTMSVESAIGDLFTRRLERARQISELMSAEGRMSHRFALILEGSTRAQVESLGNCLIVDLEETFRLSVDKTTVERQDTTRFTAEIVTYGEVLDLIKEKYPLLSISLK
ncbi:MAG: AAA family ATPase [Candidatus Obscuribacterales bacterium]|nr:AAA family ATPase [Candidatus Obscuribacterales bacterium]